MKKRSPKGVNTLVFLTGGLYLGYWLYATRKELVARGASIPSVAVLVLGMLIELAALIAATHRLVKSSPQGMNALFSEPPLLYLATLGVVIVVHLTLYAWWMQEYSKGVEFVARGKVSSKKMLHDILGWRAAAGAIFWPGRIQRIFNRL